MRRGIRFGLLILLIGCALPLAALDCAVCGKGIRGRYLKVDGKSYCSQGCYEKTLPHCSVCGKVCSGSYLGSGKNIFCSQSCYESTLPGCALCEAKLKGKFFMLETPDGPRRYCPECAALPRCFSCRLPARGGVTLPDGRVCCGECRKTALTDPAGMTALFEETRAKVSSILGSRTPCRLYFLVADRPMLEAKNGGKSIADEKPGTEELGLYSYEKNSQQLFRDDRLVGERVLSERCSVYVLDNLPRGRFIETAAHEIAHDWMKHYAPQVESEVLREGFAEYIASLVNQAGGRPELNRRMELNPDPVYGGGYRAVRDAVRELGLPAVLQNLRSRGDLR